MALIPAFEQASTKARAIGCSDCRSKATAYCKQSAGLKSAKVCVFNKRKRPSVNVPVLSKTKWVARAKLSKACPRVVNKPARVRVLVAAVIAVGVANDSAQGQVTTKTESVIASHASGSTYHQYTATPKANSSTPSTNHEATRSANWVSAGFSVWARSSKRKMCESTVSKPILSTCIFKGLSIFTVPAITGCPGFLVSG
ncbi:hypothetical protein THIOM_003183 [Candidatus Thiomargarita nelsonii]|uniref:Uncharacterized protein n=1 Tax=Candidatus Thiomargarita nelsonii TaxID=1003181 RepID=A0A176RZG3_9GAMM|nr:hypothetical protein THIOM_003183 [Candidatus Thiomargarita nelsonii]